MHPTRRSVPLPHDARTIVVVERVPPEAHTVVEVMAAVPSPAAFARGSSSAMAGPVAPHVVERARMLKHTPPPSIHGIPSLVAPADLAKTTVVVERAAKALVPAPPTPVVAPPAAPASAPSAAAPQAGKPPVAVAAKPATPPGNAPAAAKGPGPQPAKAIEPAVPTAAIPVGAPIAVPDELFALIRRIALQADLVNAAGVLASGLGELTSARVVMALVNERGEISSPLADELRSALQVVRLDAIEACVKRRQVLAAERCVLVPFASTAPAVLVVWRPATAPAIEHATIMLAVAAATRLGVIDHFLSTHAAAERQSAADAKSMFRAEALVASRQRHREGAIVDLSPAWIRVALPAIIGIAVLLIAAAALIQVPTYSRGTIVVTMNGRNVIANASGRISEVYVTPGQHVTAGQALIALDTTAERTVFEQIDTVYRDQLAAFLVDPTDDVARHSLAGILAQRTSALGALGQKTIVAPVDGTVGAILASDLVSAGEHVLTVIPTASEPSITAFMPGMDRSRIKPGMTLQIEMTGYATERQHLVITEVGEEVIGPMQARKQLGQKVADAVALPPSIVVVKAKLVGATFEARGKTYSYFDGMDGIGEIEVDARSFLATVIPTGD